MHKLKSESSSKSGHSMDASYSFVQQNKRKCNCSSSDPKWWLDHHGLENLYSFDQLKVAEVNIFGASGVDGNTKASGGKHLIEEYYACHSQNITCSDRALKQFDSHAKSDQDSCLKDFEPATDDIFNKASIGEDMEHFLQSNANIMDLDFKQPKKLSSDLDSDLIALENIEPWWHAADTCDLAFLASHRPSELDGNCDLPEAQIMHCVKGSDNCVNSVEQVHKKNVHKETKVSDVDNCTKGNLASTEDAKGSYIAQQTVSSASVDKSMDKMGLIEGIIHLSDGTLSSIDDSTTNKLDPLDTNGAICGGDISRAELLEALCHSQTRAREAENVAQQACDEKDHIVNLFFRQASYLFAYRQWLQMLQLETLCLQLRSKNEINSFGSPAILRKNKGRVPKKRPGKARCHVNKYAVAFALGLSLAGAGLLVGLTIGWIFPAF